MEIKLAFFDATKNSLHERMHACIRGGGFKDVFFLTVKFGEMIQFDEHIFFQVGGSTTNYHNHIYIYIFSLTCIILYICVKVYLHEHIHRT